MEIKEITFDKTHRLFDYEGRIEFMKKYLILKKQVFIFAFLSSLLFLNCVSTSNIKLKDNIEGVWICETKYHGNYLILIFRDEKNGILYLQDDRVSFQDSSVKNKTLAMDVFQYVFSGNEIQFIFSDGKKYNNNCVLSKNGKKLIIYDFLSTLFSEYRFKKLNSKKEEAYLKMDKEKSEGIK